MNKAIRRKNAFDRIIPSRMVREKINIMIDIEI